MTYLVFERQLSLEVARKTKVWRVTSTSGNHLGRISWHAPWRQYTFRPAPDLQTMFNYECLREIAEFCKTETEAHRSGANDDLQA